MGRQDSPHLADGLLVPEAVGCRMGEEELTLVHNEVGIPRTTFKEVDRLKLVDELISRFYGRFGLLGREVD